MIVVLAPSRGRPKQAAEMADSLRDTAQLPNTILRVIVDEDDPTLDDYVEAFATLVILPMRSTGNLVRATNSVAPLWWFGPDIIGHVGDDHRFRTPGWDRIVTDALREPGVAYGDDGLLGATLPTGVFMSSVIPRTLGWYALPGSSHLYIDNVWKDIGEGLGRLHYLPEVSIEHMHPSVGKSEWDDGYRKVNEPRRVSEDHAAYLDWQANRKERDLARLRAAIG